MSETLKPCPFCGSPPHEPYRSSGSDERMGYNFSVSISCKCGVSISKGSHHNKQGWCDDTGQAEAEVVEAWNRRDSQ